MMDWETYHFVDPWVFWFMLIIPAAAVWKILTIKKESTSLKTSNFDQLEGLDSGILPMLKNGLFVLRLLAIGFLLVALARPQLDEEADSYIEQHTEGIDMVISMDASGSMLALDFEPNRFEAAKDVAKDFVSGRKNDRIGVVVFEGESYTQCPITSDKKVVVELIDELERGMVRQGTAIGMGLATAVNRLRESEARSKVVILLTDGVNTDGKIHPLAAAKMAEEFGIRVYTIGVGSNKKAKTPVAINPITGDYIYDYQPVEIDEETLKKISAQTGGKYFRATDNTKLANIYKEIDKMEKDKIETVEYAVDLPERSFPWMLIGLIIILVEVFCRSVILRSIP